MSIGWWEKPEFNASHVSRYKGEAFNRWINPDWKPQSGLL
jgi:hypothetical protein